MIIYYAICVVISMLMYVWQCVTDVKRSLSQNIMVLATVISNIGYLCVALSKNLEEALLAMKIVYVGGCFIPVLFFLTVCEISHIYLKKSVKVIAIVVQFLLFMVVCTIGYEQIYYVSTEFKTVNGVAVLTKEYGPLHSLYPITMYGYFLASIVITIIAISKKKTVNIP